MMAVTRVLPRSPLGESARGEEMAAATATVMPPPSLWGESVRGEGCLYLVASNAHRIPRCLYLIADCSLLCVQ